MSIESIAALGGLEPALQARESGAVRGDFSNLIGQQVNQLDAALQRADQAAASLALGENIPVHEVMLTIEKARMSLQLAVEVRNRAVESYQELMRMQL